MGAVIDAIEVVKQRGALDQKQRAVEIAKVKVGAHVVVLEAAGAKQDGAVFDLGDGRVITLTALEKGDDFIRFNVAWTIDGKPQFFDNPWTIVNPPCLVEDPAGDIEITHFDLWTRKPITVRYREDPQAVLLALLADKCQRPKKGAKLIEGVAQ